MSQLLWNLTRTVSFPYFLNDSHLQLFFTRSLILSLQSVIWFFSFLHLVFQNAQQTEKKTTNFILENKE